MKHVVRITVIFIAFVLVFIVFSCAKTTNGNDQASIAEPIVIKFGHMNSPEDKVHKAAEMIKAGLAERTNGAVVIEIFPSGQLGENKEVLEQARLGSNIMGQFGLGHLEEYVHDYSIFLHPFMFNNWQEALKVTNSALVKGWEQELSNDYNIVVLGYANFGVRNLYTISKPVRSVADMKGMSIRVQPVKMYTEMIKAMGASPQTLPWMEVYSALAQGVVDGAEAPPSSMLDQKHNEVVKYLSITEHMLDVTPFCTSVEVFDSLSHEQQKILIEETEKATEWMTNAVLENTAKLINDIEASGVTVIRDVDKASFQNAMKNVWEAFPEWSDGLFEQVKKIAQE